NQLQKVAVELRTRGGTKLYVVRLCRRDPGIAVPGRRVDRSHDRRNARCRNPDLRPRTKKTQKTTLCTRVLEQSQRFSIHLFGGLELALASLVDGGCVGCAAPNEAPEANGDCRDRVANLDFDRIWLDELGR